MPAQFPPLVVAALLILETLVAPHQVAQAAPADFEPTTVITHASTDSMLDAHRLLAKKLPGRRQGAGSR